jgi:uncharacterized protein YigA (DUF484 family)
MNIVSFEAAAERKRVGELAGLRETAEDLAHFAAGSAGAEAAAQRAALALLQAGTLPEVVRVVTQQWPQLLGTDVAALALAAHDEGFRAGPEGIRRLPARRVRAWQGASLTAHVAAVDDAVFLFGSAGESVRTVALVPLRLQAPLGTGLLAFGSRQPTELGTFGGFATLDFLGGALSRMIGKCLTASN